MARKRNKPRLNLVKPSTPNTFGEGGGTMGRPPDPFDFETFEKLCGLPKIITFEDIAWIMRCSKDKLENELNKVHPDLTLSAFRTKMQGQFRSSLLSAQISAAQRGNAALLIWLGKQYLGQTDEGEPLEKPTDKQSRLIIDLSGAEVEKIEKESGKLDSDENKPKE